jgi:hypothetical protein
VDISSAYIAAQLNVENEFVVVRLLPATRNKEYVFYVGKVVQQEENGYMIQCMRRWSKVSVTQFSFPQVKDLAFYGSEDVVQHLSTPRVARGIYHFLENELATFSQFLR